MRLKLDENIASTAKARLTALGFDVDTVLDEGLGGRSDVDVWAAAQSERRFFVTRISTFRTRGDSHRGHIGLLLVRLPDSEQWRVVDYLVAWLSAPDAATWQRCFVVATPNKVRVLRPPESPAP